MADLLYKSAEKEIQKKKRDIKARCDVCHDKKLFCDDCDAEFLFYSAALKANLPRGKVDIVYKQKQHDVLVAEYSFQTGKLLTGGKKLYAEIVEPYIKNSGTVITTGMSYLWLGSNGTGKTIAATKIAVEFLKKRHSVYYITFPQLHILQSGTWRDEEKAELLQIIQKVDLLIVDELVKETSDTESVRYLADTWIKFREENLYPTILITNAGTLQLSGKTRGKNYGQSFWSMLGENYWAFVFGGEDLRVKSRRDWPL